jgi:hypothetical protein
MWTELLENPRALEMFQPEPLLEGVSLNKLLLDRDGPTVTMMIQIREYPANPPAKWRGERHNAVMIELQAMGVGQIELLGWTVDNRLSLAIRRLPEGNLRIVAVGTSVKVELDCGWLRVVGVTPYRHVA